LARHRRKKNAEQKKQGDPGRLCGLTKVLLKKEGAINPQTSSEEKASSRKKGKI